MQNVFYQILLGENLKVSTVLTAFLNSLLASLNGALEVTLLELGRTNVVQVCDILVGFPGLVVVFNGLVKLALLVEVVTNLLLGVTSFLGLLLGKSFLILGLGLRFGLRLLLRLRLGCLLSFGGRCTKVHINSQQHTHDLQETRVLDLLANTVGVLLNTLELRHKLTVREQGSCLRVVGQLLVELGVVEDSTKTSCGVTTVALHFGINGSLNGAHARLGLVVVGLEVQSFFVCIVGGHCTQLAADYHTPHGLDCSTHASLPDPEEQHPSGGDPWTNPA